ncbi:MAG: NAD(+) diphosphatase [Lachnospiraceae bacterium]|nr:NAD(+) diphosphatase [Lachnospiraceae bacterium]
MIQDIEPYVFKNQFENIKPQNDDNVFVFREKNILLKKENEEISVPKVKDIMAKEDELIYLFAIDDKKYFLYLSDDDKAAELEGYDYEPLRFLRSAKPMELSFAGETAWHLNLWYRDNRFCGRCGHKTLHHTKERAMACPECGNVIYPKIAPAVIVGITDGDRIVITRYKGREYKGIALVAGFCEIGESMEATVRREIMEEVGLKVKNIRYYKSQPWGFDQNILAGYYCELDGDDNITRQEDELSVAEWVSRDELQEQTNIISLTAEMIENFRRNGI